MATPGVTSSVTPLLTNGLVSLGPPGDRKMAKHVARFYQFGK